MIGFLLKQFVANSEEGGGGNYRKAQTTITLMVLKIGAQLDIQICHHDHNVFLRKLLLDSDALLIKSLLLLCIGSLRWCLTLHY